MNESMGILAVLGIFIAFTLIYIGGPLLLWWLSTTVYPENKTLMERSLNRLKGNWTDPVLAGLLSYAVVMAAMIVIQILWMVVSMPLSFVGTMLESELFAIISAIISLVCIPAFYIAMFVISGAWMQGYTHYFLRFVRRESVTVVDVLSIYKERKKLIKAGVAYLMITLFTMLWSLLLVVPGIIAFYSYMLTFFILEDEPELTAIEAIRKSKKLMKGHRAELMWLFCRFMGWSLLYMVAVVFTFGIGAVGALWLMPYMMTSFTEFYEKVKRGAQPKRAFVQEGILSE